MAFRQSLMRTATPSWNLVGYFKRQNVQDAPYQQVKTEEDYELNGSGHVTPTPRRRLPAPGAFQQISTLCGRRLPLATLGVLALLVLAFEYILPGQDQHAPIGGQADHKLYLLIPSSNEPDIGFCRTELTAAILGYPTPLILNHETSGRSETDQERDKIRMTNDHLGGLGIDRDEDLVVLSGSANSWFQLRPEILVKRYYGIVEQANRRLKRQYGGESPLTQQIVFAAQNHCSDHTLDDLACFAPPDSPIDKASTLRFLNAGLAIGPVKDMRRLLNRVNGKAIARYGEHLSQQMLLAEIFGEQEFRREFVRQGSWSSKKRKVESVLKALGYAKSSSITDAVPGRQLLEQPDSADYEMGIGLDYGNELGVSISRNTDRDSVDWIRHDASSEHGRSLLPLDIRRSMPPFWTTTTSSSLPINKNWSDIPLLTSKRAGGIPAVMQVAGDQRATSIGGLDWRTLWLHAYAQKLWEAQKNVPRLPLMSVVDGNGMEHTFWDQELKMDRDGANWIEGGWKPWSDHCGWSSAGEVVLLSKVQK